MAGMFGYTREAVRVKVKKCEGVLQPEFRKFSVDPQITSFEVLQSILGKAFDIKGEFTICYRTYDDCGHEIYLSILSDWELDAAFLRAHNISVSSSSEPSLCLRVDMKPFEESSEEWDVTTTNITPVIMQTKMITVPELKTGPRLQGLIMNQVEKTFNMVQRALNLGEDGGITLQQPPRPPLSDSEFRKYLDPVGQIIHAKDLRSAIYYGGIDPSLRKVVWKHILNVYPEGMSGRERMDYMKRKAAEYFALRDTWKDLLQREIVTGDLAYTTGMVRKDVLRTDRHHKFYAGSDDNQNIASLFNILTTYALNHPKVSYCQGMSDLASPLLVTMGDEAHAYICFCALMSRLGHNFMLDGIAMTQKFTHLADALLYYDPEFYNYLKSHQADDLLFCYRWLLLEMKREFAFDDSLRMLEVLWSSLPAMLPVKELPLFETQFKPAAVATPPISPLVKTPRENAYTKVCALRRQSSSISLASWAGGTTNQKPKTPAVRRQIHSLDETIGRAHKNALQDVKVHKSLDDANIILSKSKIGSVNKTSNLCKEAPVESQNGQNSVVSQSNTTETLQPRSTSPYEVKSDSSAVIKSHTNCTKDKSALSSSLSSLVMKPPKKAGHFKDLKERIAASKKGLFASLDRLDGPSTIKEEQENGDRKHRGKVVKNLNEFLNFASINKSRITDRLTNRSFRRTISVTEPITNDKPAITLTASSFDESESSQENKTSRKSSSCDDTFEGSSPDDSQEYFPMTTSMTRELRLELENLDRQVFGTNYQQRQSMILDESDSPGSDSSVNAEKNTSCDCLLSKQDSELVECSTMTTEAAEICSATTKPMCLKLESNGKIIRPGKQTDDIFVWENPLHQPSPAELAVRNVSKYPPTPDEQAELEYDGESGEIFEESQSGIKSVTPIRVVRKALTTKHHKRISSALSNANTDSSDSDAHETPLINKNILQPDFMNNGTLPQMTNSCEEATENANIKNTNSLLPPPHEFGGGNPFLMFLCITVLLQHRDYVMRNSMDYNEMAMHFDKMVRKHNVTRVLNQARQMFAGYMKHYNVAQQNNNPATNNPDNGA